MELVSRYKPLWRPLPGPQTEALNTEADILFYGGAAGGGKTDLLIGTALTKHSRSIIYRREGTQLQGIYQRLTEVLGNRDGFNSQTRIWDLKKNAIEFGSCQHPGDEIAYQGRPHDLIGYDEITHFLESQFRFLMGWLRTTKQGQRTRIICTGNPPTDSDGDWVIKFWGPWLDKDYPNPAKPGELRWFATLDGEDTEVDGPEIFEHKGEQIRPLSRTFIPSKVTDNPYLLQTNYTAQLQALPEPLRSQMLNGDFTAGKEDNPWQIIPTTWVQAAQDRWTAKIKKGEMTAIGVDPARGGGDETVIARRHDNWYDELLAYPGQSTPDGPMVASLVVANIRDAAPIQLDVIGIGSSVYDHLDGNNMQTIAMNSSNKSNATDKSGKLGFMNKRAEWWWKFREALDPTNDEGICLPNDSQLRMDLCAPRWKMSARGIQVESKEELKKRLGRSTDRGDAVVYAYETNDKIMAEKDYEEQHHGSGGWMS